MMALVQLVQVPHGLEFCLELMPGYLGDLQGQVVVNDLDKVLHVVSVNRSETLG